MWNIQFFIRVMKELAWNASDIAGIDVWFRIKKHKCLFIYYLCFNVLFSIDFDQQSCNESLIGDMDYVCVYLFAEK